MQAKNNLRVNLAVGTVTLFISVFTLYVINHTIVTRYKPDIKAILNKVIPLTIVPSWSFRPEPVERMQFLVSLILAPLIVFTAFAFVNWKKNILYNRTWLPVFINASGLIITGAYIYVIFKQNLFFVPGKTTTFYFFNNVCNKFNPVFIVLLYSLCSYLFFSYAKARESSSKKTIAGIISWLVVSLCILDIILYSIFHLSTQGWGTEMEANAVFYSITQVYAGKALLVDFNSQYGLYAWILYPVFKLIGLSTFKFSLVMGLLNGLSFLLIYLGIKKIIRQEYLAVIIFLCLLYWQYWNTRIPFADTSRAYYQYWPIRILFPSITFFLVVTYQTCAEKLKIVILPLLALNAAFAVLWNLDTGVVVFGATLIALFFFSLQASSAKEVIKKNAIYISWMFGCLLLVTAIFLLSVKIQSHHWPRFKRFIEFQNIYYVSGYYMLPMARIHFWNLTILVYLIAGICCVYYVRKRIYNDLPVLVFLVVLGGGLFSYYQGRSYDLTLNAVMYPAIIILGIFCDQLILSVHVGKNKYPESIALLLISFLFLIDGAFSMLYYAPAVHLFAADNAFRRNVQNEKILQQRVKFIESSIAPNDTVLILAQDYESYYYAAGKYYNPVNLPGSTEIIFKSQIDTLLQFIRTTKYPIVYDANCPWINSDTIIKTISQYACIEKEIPEQRLALLRPFKALNANKLIADSNSIHYNCQGDFIKYLAYPGYKIDRLYP